MYLVLLVCDYFKEKDLLVLVFIHPLLLSNCYLAQALHFWWKDYWCGTFFFAVYTPKYRHSDIDDVQMDLLIEPGNQ